MLVAGLTACTHDEPTPESETALAQLSEEEAARYRLVTETREELDDWFDFYNLDADSVFKLREIWNTDLLTVPATPDWQQVYRKHRKRFTPSPDKQKVLDIYTFNHTLTAAGKHPITTTPDSEAAIVDLETGERVRLMFCGNVCQYHAAWWRNPDEIVVVGLVRGFDHKNLYPAIWHINMYTQTIEQFTATKPADPDKNRNYLKEEVFD
ncbi:hypothetical protein [Pontibacter fetidus]|uniref:Uncharacterized protein n=1 Tax=Pontibacter fetidus TaxID=2700082 RepID=A0A6B2H7B1_9BACT|nr:hypothetical protein [Pontibacter fetidus]NDK55820.1 hypothetical protein [Pontibacter fetidus]